MLHAGVMIDKVGESTASIRYTYTCTVRRMSDMAGVGAPRVPRGGSRDTFR